MRGDAMHVDEGTSTLPGLLGDEAWSAITPNLDLRTFGVGELMVRQGDLNPDFLVIEKGVAAVVAAASSGERRELGRLRAGDCAGELSLLTGEPASADVVPITPVVAYCASQEQIGAMGDHRVRLMGALSAILASRLQYANERLLSRRASNAVIVCGSSSDIASLLRLPSAIARVTGEPVTVVAYSDEHLQAMHSSEPVDDRVELVRSEGDLPELLERISKEHRQALVLCDARQLTDAELEGGQVYHVSADPNSGSASVGQHILISREAWTVPVLRRLSDSTGREICAAIPPSGGDMERLARLLTRRRVGVAFGAGAAKGLAHMGVLRAFEEMGVPIDVVSGASIGAAVAAGVAAGTNIDELEALVNRVAGKVVRPTVPMHSLLSNAGVRDELRQAAGDTRIEDLNIPLAVVAVDLFRRAEVTFTSGLVWPRIIASTAIPGVYPAVPALGSYLVDGGILTPVPARQCRELGADIVVGIRLTATRTSPREKLDRKPGKPLAVEAMIRAFEIMQNRLSEMSHEPSDVTIEVCVEGTGGLRDFKRGPEIAQVGYEATIAAQPALSEVMPYAKGAA